MLLIIQLLAGVIAIARGWEWWLVLLGFILAFGLGFIIGALGITSLFAVLFGDLVLAGVLILMAFSPPTDQPVR